MAPEINIKIKFTFGCFPWISITRTLNGCKNAPPIMRKWLHDRKTQKERIPLGTAVQPVILLFYCRPLKVWTSWFTFARQIHRIWCEPRQKKHCFHLVCRTPSSDSVLNVIYQCVRLIGPEHFVDADSKPIEKCFEIENYEFTVNITIVGDEGRKAFEQSQLSAHGFQGIQVRHWYNPGSINRSYSNSKWSCEF